MSVDWYPAIRECCDHWNGAPMLQQTYEAMVTNFDEGNDACIDCAKSVVEVVCRIIVDELDDPATSQKPKSETPSFGDWVTAAVKTLKLGNDPRDSAFQKLVSQHNKLTTSLGALRNDAGPVSHGKDGFIERLSVYHQRAAILSADAIVAFLHQAYREAEMNLARTREPYTRFATQNDLIDKWCGYALTDIDDEGMRAITVELPNGAEQILIDASPSQLLFQLDRSAYIEALNAAISAEALAPSDEELDA